MKHLFDLCLQIFRWLCKNLCSDCFLWKISIFVGNHLDCGNISRLIKISLTVKIFIDYGKNSLGSGKLHLLWKSSLTLNSFCECGKVPWSSKIPLTVGKFFDQGKFPWGKVPWLSKISLNVENILSWLQKNNRSNSFENKY